MIAPVTSAFPLRRFLGAVLLAWGGLAAAVATIPPEPPLTSIKAVRSLPPQKASEALPVVVRGVVTRITPYELFVQEGPDAIFVWQEPKDPALQLGDYVEVVGVTNSGHLFPIVRSSEVRWLGHHSLPEPRMMSYAEMATGRGDCQWVEVAGIVETVREKPDGSMTMQLLYDGALLRVELLDVNALTTSRLLGARVRLRGVVNGLKTPQRRLIEPVLCTAGTAQTLWVEEPGPEDVFDLPLTSVAALGGPDGVASQREMVHVAGTVTSQPSSRLVFVRDGAQSLEIRLVQPVTVSVGDAIEAVGFSEMGVVQPLLKNALLRRVAAGQPPAPRRLQNAAELLDLGNEADLVEVEGELRDISHRSDGYLLVLAQGGQAFNVEIPESQVPAPSALPPVGSRLAITGICQIERLTPPDLNQIVTPALVRIHLRSLDELRVLSRPSWWTPERLLALVAVLSLFALGALGWIWTLNRRVQAQTRIILGNARKQATLEERNRIAREFHDTLEQQLAGATFLLDAIDTVVVDQPQRARDGLQTARAMLRHSLDDAQQAVANLRNNDLFERAFVPVIEDAVSARLAGTGIPVEFRIEGKWPELDSMVKQHLLRIVQESVTNAAKHATPHRVVVTLRATADNVEIEVADDGRGFVVPDPLRGDTSEFGLIGLRERAEKIGARLTIRSAPSAGTTIAVALRPDTALSAL